MPGYRFEYAPTSRVKCKGPKPCAGTIIQIGSLRLGCTVEFNGRASFAWRHWGCVTTNLISNIKSPFPDASDVDGFEELKVEDQAKIIQAWKDGHVADEDSNVSRSIFRGMKAWSGEKEKPLGEMPSRNLRKRNMNKSYIDSNSDIEHPSSDNLSDAGHSGMSN